MEHLLLLHARQSCSGGRKLNQRGLGRRLAEGPWVPAGRPALLQLLLASIPAQKWPCSCWSRLGMSPKSPSPKSRCQVTRLAGSSLILAALPHAVALPILTYWLQWPRVAAMLTDISPWENAWGQGSLCERCSGGEPGNEILLCDHCGKAWHFRCLQLDGVPEGDWQCARCSAEPGRPALHGIAYSKASECYAVTRCLPLCGALRPSKARAPALRSAPALCCVPRRRPRRCARPSSASKPRCLLHGAATLTSCATCRMRWTPL